MVGSCYLFEVVVAPPVQQGVDADRRHGQDVTPSEDGDGPLFVRLGNFSLGNLSVKIGSFFFVLLH